VTAAAPDVVVALPTFRRPVELARILPEVVEQAGKLDPPARVVVIDNDPDGGAREEVERWADHGVRYAQEPTPGLAAVRNRSLDEAAGADAVVFIDDDEVPSAGWLEALVSAWKEWDCAAVIGPVTPVFEVEPSPWVLGSGVFDRMERPDGMLMKGGATNNLLLDLAELERFGLRFHAQFGLTSGEDTLMLHGLTRRGGIARWCARADVQDYIPASRLTRKWVILRSLRTSGTWSKVHLELAGTPARRLRERVELTLRGVHRAGRGLARFMQGVVRRDVRGRARGTVDLVSALGMTLGAWGWVYQEYLVRRRPTG
jgi:succinoglycan biosynthesis protein ExoM